MGWLATHAGHNRLEGSLDKEYPNTKINRMDDCYSDMCCFIHHESLNKSTDKMSKS